MEWRDFWNSYIDPRALCEWRATLSGSTKTLSGSTLVNGGAGAWTAGQITAIGGGFSNAPAAIFDIQADGNTFVLSSGSPFLANAGTIRKTGGTGTSVATVACAKLRPGASQQRHTRHDANRWLWKFTTTAGTKLTVNGLSTLSASASINGPGNFEVTGGSITNHGTLNIGGSNTFSGGTVKLDGTCTINNAPLIINGGSVSFSGAGNLTPSFFNLSAGILQGSIAMIVQGPFAWSGGSFGVARVKPGGHCQWQPDDAWQRPFQAPGRRHVDQ